MGSYRESNNHIQNERGEIRRVYRRPLTKREKAKLRRESKRKFIGDFVAEGMTRYEAGKKYRRMAHGRE